jgi:transcriptional regulator with XRE-family HTH domain
MPYLRARYERQRRNLTLNSAAKLAKLTTMELSLIERGRLIPTTAQLAKLVAVYEVAAEDLLKQVDDVPTTTT